MTRQWMKTGLASAIRLLPRPGTMVLKRPAVAPAPEICPATIDPAGEVLTRITVGPAITQMAFTIATPAHPQSPPIIIYLMIAAVAAMAR